VQEARTQAKPTAVIGPPTPSKRRQPCRRACPHSKRHGTTRKKQRPNGQAGAGECKGSLSIPVRASARSRPRQSSVPRRNHHHNEAGPPLRTGSAWQAWSGRGAVRALKNYHRHPRSVHQRSDRAVADTLQQHPAALVVGLLASHTRDRHLAGSAERLSAVRSPRHRHTTDDALTSSLGRRMGAGQSGIPKTIEYRAYNTRYAGDI
jgi:hypothetical protein